MNNSCPKCKTGKLAGDKINYTADVISCHNCGLLHVIGAQKESLERQIKGVEPAAVSRRREFNK